MVFIEGEKGFSKNPFSKGISDPKTGLKRAIRPHPAYLVSPAVMDCYWSFVLTVKVNPQLSETVGGASGGATGLFQTTYVTVL